MAKTSGSAEDFFEILEMVKSEFPVKDSYLKNGVPTFIITSESYVREKMDTLRLKLQEKGLDLIVWKSNGDFTLIVGALKVASQTSNMFSHLALPFFLMVATVVTVTLSGYFQAGSYVQLLNIMGKPAPSTWEITLLYTVSVMGYLGLHELGHLIACRIHHVKASLPLFIPGIPGVSPGTLGAIVRQESPILNRDQLFDIGAAGPMLSFVAALVISYFGYSWSVPVTEAEYLHVISVTGSEGTTILLPVLFMLLSRFILPNPTSYTHFLHPVAWAGWVCTLITFLNAFPIGQLDGGHVFRAILGRKWHKRLSYIMIVVMALLGWWVMALLAFFLARSFFHPGALDDVTQVTKKRKIAGVFFILIFIACITFSIESPLLRLILPWL